MPRVGFPVLACALLVVGCAEETSVIVWLDADEGVRTEAQRIRVVVRGPDGPADMVVHELGDPDLPVAIRLRPRGGDASRRYVVEAELLGADDAPVATTRARSYFVGERALELRLRFDALCRGVSCDAPLACFEGACVDACVDPTPPGAVMRSVFTVCDDSPPLCDEGERSCEAAQVVMCVDGTPTSIESCRLGCAVDEARCLSIQASNIPPDTDLDEATGALRVPSAAYWEIDTDALSVASFPDGPGGVPVVEMPEGVLLETITITSVPVPIEAALLRAVRVTVEERAVLRAFGSRPLIVIASDGVVIDGTLSTASDARIGAGGSRGGLIEGGDLDRAGAGCGGGGRGEGSAMPSNEYSGGGGGGYGSAGGDGGPTSRYAGGAGGAPCATPDLVPLVGGSGGGTGGNGTRSGAGGHGGGALQISTEGAIRVGPMGVLDASGGGAPREPDGFSAGGGGGSGGALLLEAREVVLAEGAAVGANGGGGSSAGCSDGPRGAGEHGRAGGAPAMGGPTCGTPSPGSERPGADGSDVDGSVPELEQRSVAAGGGGGAGTIRFNLHVGDGTELDPARFRDSVQPFVVDELFFLGALRTR